MSVAYTERAETRSTAVAPAWLFVGAGIYLLLLIRGDGLLRDADTFWQIKVGQWIAAHHAVPFTDIYSFTRAGEPWISTSWLAQVLFAQAFDLGGWAGVVVLTALAAAAALALLAHVLCRFLPPLQVGVVICAVFALASPHLLARPHVLAMPVMIAWASGLVSASGRGGAPSPWLLALMIAWANLHGGFVFGLALIGAFALDAVWNAEAARRKRVVFGWALFGFAALVASCVTPYGWGTLLAARNILGLGEALSLIIEWRPVDFSHVSALEVCLLGLLGLALFRGVRLTPPRILLVLGLTQMALAHSRSIEVFAFLLPLVVAEPLSVQFSALRRTESRAISLSAARLAVVVFLLCGFTAAFAASRSYVPASGKSLTGAVQAMKDHGARRVLNEYFFGGLLIAADVPVFIDGRTELYGEQFVLAHVDALQLRNVGKFLTLLDTYRIDATLLDPSSPAVHLLDRLDGWRRVYSDGNAVLHMRTANLAPQIRPSLD
ncbi:MULTISPECIES: hypothetical protein [unclassified Nitrobacter]|uniref:hypothetical protein n=1 Tax=unclassified Nitrobacter TaxID=2620411 RepID=UPI0009265346|nr:MULTISPECIES: hypothetical protein [unclassified Nitrobacter]MBN9148018.1 hypothetical protein [Nitrobacter sp.]OJV03916.1 MAG: hypothetical protein BGO16_05860 [Nitrobacter sp. 62-23]